MSFKEANEKLSGTFTEQADAMYNGSAPAWLLSGSGSISEFMKQFDTETENSEWKELTNTHDGDLNEVVGVRARIAWMCGARADLRRQFSAGTDDHVRNHIDMRRFSYLQQRQRQHGLAHANDLLDVERRKPVTG